MMLRMVAVVAIAGTAVAGCRFNGPVGDHPGTAVTAPDPSLMTETTREVLTKRAPDTLVARDGSSCRVAADVYAATAIGSQFRCPWIPSSAAPGA
jgi:hypothetical protein